MKHNSSKTQKRIGTELGPILSHKIEDLQAKTRKQVRGQPKVCDRALALGRGRALQRANAGSKAWETHLLGWNPLTTQPPTRRETPASQGRARPSPPCPSPASEAKIWERRCALSSPPASGPGPEGAERACGRGCGRFPLGRPRAPLAPPGALGGPGGARGRREERRRGEARTGTPPGSSGYLWESWLMGHTGTVLVRLLACHGVLGERSELCRRKHWMTRSCL